MTANAGEMAAAASGNITYQDAFVNPVVAQNEQFALPGDWTLGVLDCTTARCRAFDQISNTGATAVGVTDFVIARTRFQLDPGGPCCLAVTFNWQTTPASQSLNFFGAPASPGLTITVGQVIPEPATGALLALGVLGLAHARRRAAR